MKRKKIHIICCCCSAAKLCPTLCNPTDCSTISWSLLQFMSLKLVMLSKPLILGCPLLHLPSVFSSIRVFSNDQALCIRWSKQWSFSFRVSPSNEYLGLISLRIGQFDLLAVQGTLKRLLQHHRSKASILRSQPSSWSNSHIHT